MMSAAQIVCMHDTRPFPSLRCKKVKGRLHQIIQHFHLAAARRASSQPLSFVCVFYLFASFFLDVCPRNQLFI